ncbi:MULTISPECIES: non-ribosomal peptide synthetase [unclassified Brenneria]|uniref:non-ribosomal peptide synthetase n=1 Tax=unclassified Brenneria TaxID=2634434 RepID=UPI001553599E|nr:non-ribosomal peptide synthetase [Brenneria sp. hezel4-2-4]MEE3653000.1 non-ribosomal peptide synthetase [Brenneria sp. HEZEL_4_2_4]NPD02953.1 non-ribosomal peptide synthetase [Brenneria sp. hezel4-2-4]
MNKIIDCFGKIVKKFPQHIALVNDTDRMTYSELDLKSTQVANYLIKNNMSGKLICLHLESSFELVVCILGVLKSSGSYTCLDTRNPQLRKEMILKYAKAVISDRPLNTQKCPVISYDSLFESSSFEHQVTQNNELMCVIFTSGSTGQPKGVMLSHDNILSFINTQDDINENDCMAQFSSISFDAFQFELWSLLLKGGSLCFTSPKLLLKREELQKTVRQQGITLAFVTSALVNAGVLTNFIGCPSFRRLYFGGEQVQPNAIARDFSMLDYELMHCYGPSEASVWNVSQLVKEVMDPLPLGKPLANSKLKLMDQSGREIRESNTNGEIYLGGDCVAMGYLLDEELTHRNFILLSGERYFKTSDIAYWDENRQLIFSHRADNTIKLHGFRINLGEIDNEMASLDAAIQSKTIIHKGELGDLLVTFYCQCEMKEDVLRKKLSSRLPEYMIPNRLIKIDLFPLTTNGKVDVSVLTEKYITTEPVLIGDEDICDVILDIWRKLLGTKNIGYDDKYFEVGGNSVLMLKLHREMIKKFNVKIKMNELFTSATISQQAELINSKISSPYYS